jgi:membrane protease subunit (stomatin/prohibitin family)
MGLWDSIKSGAINHAQAQFLDVLQWVDETRDTMVFRFPTFQQVIQDGAKLVVREGQAAIFVQEGVMSPVFGPGTHDISTRSPAIMGFFQGIKYGFEGPFKGEVYFVNTRQFTDQKWGTANPIPIRDKDFGMVRLRAFGAYAFRVSAPDVFHKELVATSGLLTTEDITGQLKRKMITVLADTIGEAKIPLLDLVAQYADLGDALKERINPQFQQSYGITITDFAIENISVPEEVEKAMDRRASMGALGDMNTYTQFQAANAIQAMAENSGGGAPNTMLDAGMGLAMGQMFGQAFNRGGPGMAQPQPGMAPPPAPGTAPPPLEVRYHYNGPGAPQGEYSATQIAGFVAGNRGAAHSVWAAGWPGWQPASNVPDIARLVPPAPPPVAAPPPIAGPPVIFHYNGPAGASQASAADIAAQVRANPSARHLVWKDGMPTWTEAAQVPEIAALLNAGPPPIPGGPPPIPGGPPPIP